MEHNFTKEYFEQERKKVDELIRLASVKRSPKTGKEAEALTNEIRERAKYFSQNPEEAKRVLEFGSEIETKPVEFKPMVNGPVIDNNTYPNAVPGLISRRATLPRLENKSGTVEESAAAPLTTVTEGVKKNESTTVTTPVQTSPAKTENGDKYIDMSSLKISPKANAMGVEMKADDTKDAIVTFDKDGKARLAEKYKDVEITPDMSAETAYNIAKAKINEPYDLSKVDTVSVEDYKKARKYYTDLAGFLEGGVALDRALELAGQSDAKKHLHNDAYLLDTAAKGTTHVWDSALNLMDEIDIATKTKVVDPIVRNAKDFWAKLTGKEKNENDRIIWKPSELIDNFIDNVKEEKKKADADYEKAMKEHIEYQKSDIAAPNPYNNFGMGENGYYDPEYTLTHSKPGRFVTDAAYQGGRMIPSIAAGSIAGTAAKAVGLTAKGVNIASKIASNGTLFANVYTNAKARAINEGASLKQAENYAFISATIETAVENISSGIAGFGTGVLDNMGFKAINNVTNPVMRGIFKGVGTATGEAIEEMGAEVLDVGARKFTYDPKATVKLSDVLYAGALGAFISAPGAATGGVSEYTVTKSTYDALNSIIEAAGKVSTPAETSAVISFMDSFSAASADMVKDIDTLGKTEAAKKYGVSPEDIDRLRTDALITKLELSRATKAMTENMYSIFKANEESGVASEHENEVIARITSEIKNGNVDLALSIAQNEIDMNTQAMRDIASRKSLSDADKASMTGLLAKRNTAWEDVINHIKSGNVERLSETASPDTQTRTESTDDSRADTPRLTTPANDTAAPVVENAAPAQNEAKPGAYNPGANVSNENRDDAEALPEVFKRDSDSTGKIRFVQADIDYNNKSIRKSRFNISNSALKTVSVDGHIRGKYGIHKDEKTGKYVVTLLQSGAAISSFNNLTEAKRVAEYLDDNTTFNDTAYSRTLSGRYVFLQSDEFKAFTDDLKRILTNKEYESASTENIEIKDGKVPFTTKAGLVEFARAHIGGKVKVTFGNGVSEERTVDSVSTKSIKTKKPDGSISTLDLTGLSFKDTGFFADFGNGNTVDYDFVNVSETPESVTKTVENEKNTPVAEEKTEYKHLYNEETVSEDFINSVNPEIESAILNIRSGNIEAVPDVVEVTELTEETIKKISDFVGFDVSGYSCKIEKDALQHIENRHGINGSHDHSLSDPKDTARMGYIVNNSDSVDWIREKDGAVKTSKKYRDKNNKPAKLVMVQKKIDGTYCVSDVVPDSKNKTIWVTSARIQKKHQDLDDNNVSPKTTPENALNASDTIIAEETKNVNTSEETTTPTLTDKCELHETTHTKTGEALWVISLNDKISSDEYKTLSAAVKKVGGYYSRFAKDPNGKAIPGFIFNSKPDDNVIELFNNFFGYKGENTSNVLNNETEGAIIKENADKDGDKNVKPQSEVLDRESKTDDRGLRSRTSEDADKASDNRTERASRDDSREVLQGADVDDADRSNVGNDGKGAYRADDIDATAEQSPRTDAEITDAPDAIDTQVKTIKNKRPSNKGNFFITNDIAAEFDNTLPNAKDNIDAIELLLSLENEGRQATPEEMKTLAKYKGWGGIDIRRIPWELNRKLYNLYNAQQLKDMQSSQNSAFFTPTKVIDAMYDGLKRMGFKGGNILETSMGIGNFFGRMPKTISAKSALTGVELESYTARIAQYLYPGATVINMPFQDVAIKNGSYDLVIGNVPFGQNKISYNKKKYSLHNYFIISSLDKVRDGGIVAVITSASTLESHSIDARKAIMDRADVIACYKLPEKVFSRNASTDVQTDLLILRKRANSAKPSGDSILDTTTTPDGLRINEYFIKHPENILGTLAKGTNAWGEITTVLDTGNFYDRLTAAMKALPKDIISGSTELKPIETIVSVSEKPRFFEKNGKIYADDGAGTATEVSKAQTGTVRDYIAVRDAYKALLNAYDMDLSDDAIKPMRDALSKAYDTFYDKHGAITGDGKKKIGDKKSANNTFLEADADYYLVSGLERYDAKNSTFVKSALFEKDTLRKKKVTSVELASDALAVSLNESGKIDFARMSELTGKSEKELAKELEGEIILTPEGDYVLTDIYLSGNIYEKLEAVKGKSEFAKQAEMLEKVIPTPKGPSDITVKLGANFIDAKYIEQFAREIFNTTLTIRKDISGRWIIEGVKQSRYGDLVNVKYGCSAFNAVQLLEKILNDGEITATKKARIGDKDVSVLDSEMTDIARQKADDIRSAFESWIFSNSDRRAKIVENYNRIYNNYRPLDYGRIAEKLSFDSMDDSLKSKLYPHQKKGIARFLFGGNILFAHGVGTGKTFEMIASVMEAKRMGIINKAAMVVPNNKVVDFKNDIAQAYPDAKVLVIDTANKKRQTMLGLVNSNDWDIVLIARTTFTRIPVSRELQAHYIAQQLEDLELQIAEATSDRGISKRQLKGMITQRDNFEQKLKDLNSETSRDENSVDFEKLGIDCICVDEAHNYKSIMTPTKLDIKGLVNRNNAQMANDMLMKLDYIRSIDGKIIFGTGTPITNTVSEIYNMMRMIRPDILEEAGIHSLDEWVNTFAKIETTTEIGIDNQIKAKSTQIIRSFINVSEMIGMFRQFADIVFTGDVVKNLPKAVYFDVELDGTEEHKRIEKHISEVITKTKKTDLLKVYGQLMSMADAASVDLRMLSGAESEHNIFKDYTTYELDYENSKINTMCDNVLAEYKASNNIRGTQIIFCDKGSGSGTVYSFNLHKDIMQKLVERGIPEKQIVIIKNQSDAQLEELYDKVNEGEVRVLIGTSQKMAEGLNVQKRVVAIHHPTVTYKPSDKEQGDARGVRAGNINDEVHIYRYLQKNTFDSHKWQAQDRKGEMINKALRGEVVAEMEDIGADEDSGAGVDAATAMAITSGNPLVKEKIDIDKEVVRLKTLQRNYLSELYRYQDAIAKNPDMIRQLDRFADNIERDIALRGRYSDKAVVVIKGKSFDKQTDANKALSEAVKSAPKNGQFTKLGAYNGFDIMFKGDTGGMNYLLILKGANEYSVEYAAGGNTIARFAGVLGRLDAELKKTRGISDTLKSDLEFAKQEVTKPFEKERELTEALEKQKDITYRYEHYREESKKAETQSNVDDADEYRSRAGDNQIGAQADNWRAEKKIAVGMSDSERYEILKDKEINLIPYNKEKLTALVFENGHKFDINSLINVKKADAKRILKALSEKFEVFKKYYNGDINISFEYSKTGLGESVNKQKGHYDNIAKLLTVMNDVVDNAVAVEVHSERYSNNDSNLNATYVLVSAFENENGIVPVKLLVKTFLDNTQNTLHMIVSANEIVGNIKKNRSRNVEAVQANVSNNPHTRPVPTISLADLFANVNTLDGDFIKYIPDGFLSPSQIEAKKQALIDETEYIDNKNQVRYNVTGEKTTDHTQNAVDALPEDVDVIQLRKIVDSIAKWFGVHVNVGKTRGALGRTPKNANSVWLSVANDIPTLSHELGHVLDNRYGITQDFPDDMLKSLVKIYETDLKERGYKDKQMYREAFAEFIRDYISGRDMDSRASEFVSKFKDTLSKEDLDKLNRARSLLGAYLNSSKGVRMRAALEYRIDRASISGRLNSLAEAVSDVFDDPKGSIDIAAAKFAHAFLDRYAPIEMAIKKVSGDMQAYRDFLDISSAAGITNGILNLKFSGSDRTFDNDVPTLRSIIALATSSAKDVKDVKSGKAGREFDMYLLLKHALDVMPNGVRVFADDDIDITDIQNEIEMLEKEYSSFFEASEMFYELNRKTMHEWLVKTGVMSEELFDALNEKYPHHVSLYRVFNDKLPGEFSTHTRKGSANQRLPFKRLRGSGLGIFSPLENTALNVYAMVSTGLKNKAARSFVSTISESGPEGSTIVERVSPDMHLLSLGTDDILTRLEVFRNSEDAANILNSLNGEQTEQLFSALADIIGDRIQRFEANELQKNQVLSYLVDGEREYYKIYDPMIFDILTGNDMAPMTGIENVAQTLTRMMSTLTTSFNFIWGTANIARDNFMGYYRSDTVNDPIKYELDWLKSILTVYFSKRKIFSEKIAPEKAERFIEYLAAGGGYTTLLTASYDNLAAIMREVGLPSKGGIIDKAWNIIVRGFDCTFGAISNTDDIVRFAEYDRCRSLGYSVQDALLASRRAGIDYAKRGTVTTRISFFVPFFGATVAAIRDYTDKIFKGKYNTPAQHRAAVAKVIILASLIVLMQLLLRASLDDEEKREFDDISNRVKNTSYVLPIKTKDGKYIRLPKEQSSGWLASLIYNTVIRATTGENAFRGFGTYTAETYIPGFDLITDPMGQIIGVGAIVQLMSNRAWNGADIVPASIENLPKELQYDGKTTVVAKAIGDMFNTSPVKVDYFNDQLLGVAHDITAALFPVDPSERDYLIGLGNRFTVDPAYSNDIVNTFYDAKEKHDTRKEGYKFTDGKDKQYTEKDVYLSKKYEHTASVYSALNKRRKAASENSTERAIRKLMNETVRRVNLSATTDIDIMLMQFIDDYSSELRAKGVTRLTPSDKMNADTETKRAAGLDVSASKAELVSELVGELSPYFSAKTYGSGTTVGGTKFTNLSFSPGEIAVYGSAVYDGFTKIDGTRALSLHDAYKKILSLDKTNEEKFKILVKTKTNYKKDLDNAVTQMAVKRTGLK